MRGGREIAPARPRSFLYRLLPGLDSALPPLWESIPFLVSLAY